MRLRTPEEQKAWLDGFEWCFTQFVEHLKHEESVSEVIQKMETLKSFLHDVVERKEEWQLTHLWQK